MNEFDFSVIRNLRTKRKISAEDLARRAGLTRMTVAKIENNEGNPTLGTINALARVFGLSSGELVSLAEQARVDEPVVTGFRSKGFNGKRIRFPGFELFRLRAGKGAESVFEPGIHQDTDEVCLVLSGRIRLAVAGQELDLAAGDARRFRAMHEHRITVVEAAEFFLIHHHSA